MSRQFSLPYEIPPVSLLVPAADAAGRTSSYRSLRTAQKAYVVCEVNQGNAAQVTFSVLQAKDSLGTGSKAISAVPVWLQANTATSDANVAQTAGIAFQTSAATNDKIVVFEITPDQALDVTNGYNHVAVSTSASNAANITEAKLYVLTSFKQATPPTTYV